MEASAPTYCGAEALDSLLRNGITALFVEEPAAPLRKASRAKLEEVLPDSILVAPALLPAWLAKVERALLERRRPVAPAA